MQCFRIEVLENALAQLSAPSRREEEARGAQVGAAVELVLLVLATDVFNSLGH